LYLKYNVAAAHILRRNFPAINVCSIKYRLNRIQELILPRTDELYSDLEYMYLPSIFFGVLNGTYLPEHGVVILKCMYTYLPNIV
jgi:hypothetical protein